MGNSIEQYNSLSADALDVIKLISSSIKTAKFKLKESQEN